MVALNSDVNHSKSIIINVLNGRDIKYKTTITLGSNFTSHAKRSFKRDPFSETQFYFMFPLIFCYMIPLQSVQCGMSSFIFIYKLLHAPLVLDSLWRGVGLICGVFRITLGAFELQFHSFLSHVELDAYWFDFEVGFGSSSWCR